MFCNRHFASLLRSAGTLGVMGALGWAQPAPAFEGRILATLTQGTETNVLLYTVVTNQMRIENTETNWPRAKNIINLDSGEVTLLFPHNRSFVRLKTMPENSSMPGFPQMPGALPPGVGSQTQLHGAPAMQNMPMSQHIVPTNLPGMPTPPSTLAMPNMPPEIGAPTIPIMPGMSGGMPAMPMMPPIMEQMELQDIGQKTNLLGLACELYEIKQRGETMVVWATDQLFPFQPYLQNQPHRFGPRMIEEQWGDLLKAKKLFPLLAILKFDNGPERFRFEVKSIMPQKLTDDDAELFQPPTNYFEIQPLPF